MSCSKLMDCNDEAGSLPNHLSQACNLLLFTVRKIRTKSESHIRASYLIRRNKTSAVWLSAWQLGCLFFKASQSLQCMSYLCCLNC